MRTPLRVCHNCCHLPCCVPLAPETHSHSGILSGLCSDFHHYTHNNFTPLPGSSRGCLPRSCPARLYLQLLALQLVNDKCTGSLGLLALTKDSGEHLQGGRVSGQQPPTHSPHEHVMSRAWEDTSLPAPAFLKPKALGPCHNYLLTLQMSPSSALQPS